MYSEGVTVSAISALQGCEPQLKAHVSGARNMGVADAQLHDIPAVLRSRVGETEAVRCEQAVASVFGEPCQTVAPVDFNATPHSRRENATPHSRLIIRSANSMETAVDSYGGLTDEGTL